MISRTLTRSLIDTELDGAPKRTRLEKLKELEADLYKLMQKANSRSIAPLAKQYRDTIREIDEIENAEESDDEIEEIMQKRKDNGDAGAVRKSRT